MKILVMLSIIAKTLLSDYQATGKATYYGQHWTGRLTASGERFHADSLTCAHKTLPFGTLLDVIDLRNGNCITVKVTDRLPKTSRILIDLTYGAAKQLGFLRAGIIPVQIISIGKATIRKR
jgi:rare lipoprotein A